MKTEILDLRYVQSMGYCSLYMCMVYAATSFTVFLIPLKSVSNW